jgi:hypothetical protein
LETLVAQESDEGTIRAAITAQVEAWNRADIPTFMQAYENSTKTTFIGKNIVKGYKTHLQQKAKTIQPNKPSYQMQTKRTEATK